MRPRLTALAACCALATGLAACGGDDKKAEPADTDSTEQTTATKAESSGRDPIAKTKLEHAIGFYNQQYDRFLKVFDADTKRDDFEKTKSDIAKYRTVFFLFDKKLRAIEFDDSLVPQVNSILEQNTDLIAKLDEIGQTSGFDAAAPLYDQFVKDRATEVKAINKLHDQL